MKLRANLLLRMHRPTETRRRQSANGADADVARITVYVVNYQRDYHLPIIEEARLTLFGDHKAADVVVGVAALSPDYLIEVDAIAVVDG